MLSRGVCMSSPWFRISGTILFRQLGRVTGLVESDLGHGKRSPDQMAQRKSAPTSRGLGDFTPSNVHTN